MILGFWLGTLLIILLGVGMIALCAFIWKKLNKNSVAGGTIGFFIGFALCVVLFVIARSMYVVTGDGEFSSYYVYGTPEYTMENGDIVTIDLPMAQSIVMNESDTVIVIEEVIYGSFHIGDGNIWVDRGEFAVIDGGRIHYFYDNEPPEEISTKNDDDYEVRWWLRNKRD